MGLVFFDYFFGVVLGRSVLLLGVWGRGGVEMERRGRFECG